MSEFHFLQAPVVSSVTEEFTPEFLEFWKYKNPPRILNWTEPYRSHVAAIPSITWILTESVRDVGKLPRYIVVASPYAGFTGLRTYKLKEYREFVRSHGI